MPPEFMLHPRNRERELRTPSNWKKVIAGVNYPSSSETFQSPDIFEKASIGDQSNGNFRKKQRAGVPVLGPMTISKSSRSSGGTMSPMVVTASWSGGSRVTTFTGDFWSGGSEANINSLFTNLDLEKDLGGMRTTSIAKALAKVNGSDMLVGETLADFTKTVMMLRSPFKGATDLVSRMVKSRNRVLKRSGSNIAKASADCWLEYSYGWKPLLLDGEKIIDHAMKKREFGRAIRVARAEERRSISPVVPFSFGSTTDPKWNRAGTAQRKQTVRACSGVMYSLNNCTPSDQLARLLGSRACDLPSTAWELIPFSFVVDWFLNVGTWIRASVPDPSIAILGMWTTSLCKTETVVLSCHFTYSEYVEPGVYAQGSASVNLPRWTTEWVQRNTNPTVAAYPELTIKLSAPRSLSALALATQQIVGRLGTFKH